MLKSKVKQNDIAWDLQILTDKYEKVANEI